MRINIPEGETQKKKVHRVLFNPSPMNSKHVSNAIKVKTWTVNNVFNG